MPSLITSALAHLPPRQHAPFAAFPPADAAEEGEEAADSSWREIPPKIRRADPASLEWVFWGFLLCMAIAALPLIGIRWTTPESAQAGGVIGDVVLLALPVLIPLPCLFAGCIGVLALNAASRTVLSVASFGAGLAIGAAAIHAVVA